MTQILLNPLASDFGLPGWAPVDVDISVTPWAGGKGAIRVFGANLILPDTDVIQYRDELYSKPFNLQPTSNTWCWKITLESLSPRVSITRFVVVPDVVSIDWQSLIDVDPNNYLPTSTPEAAWAVELTNLQTYVNVTFQQLQAQIETGATPEGLNAVVTPIVTAQLTTHINDTDPHPVYDNGPDGPSLVLQFENGLV